MRAFFILGLSGLICLTPAALALGALSTAPAAGPGEPLLAECIKVKGKVQWAPLGTKTTDSKAWKPVKLGEKYPDGILIRTGVRSAVIFRFGADTVAKIDRVTLAAIGEFRKTGDIKRIRFGLDYGTVRAGVAEGMGELRSDLEIDAPTVTLSKRGTWDFQLWVERGTGRFDAKLAERGLVEVIQKTTGRRRQIRPHQWVNQAMLNWVETAKFDRDVVVADTFSQTADELLAYLRNSTGRTGLNPAGLPAGVPVSPTAMPTGQAATGGVSQNITRTSALNALRNALDSSGPVPSDDGDFGTGSFFDNKDTAKRRGPRLIGNTGLFRRVLLRRR
jgi:hypothetical protein